jgi:2-oxoglutarate ferredoxin oxidoreductase subunit gamma
MSVQIRLSGSGGQGILLAGIILAEAGIMSGKNAVQSQSYGPEARGGASKAEVIISSESIDYPKVTCPDVMLALTQEAYEKYSKDMSNEGVLVIDESIKPSGNDNCKIISVPVIVTARDTLGRIIVANMVALGALVKASSVITFERLEEAVLRRVPKGTEELNKKAIKAGFDLVTL